jgi:hypothetical protein
MNSGLKRKEVWLPKSVLSYFEIKAKEKQWSLKKFMEQALIEKYQSYKEPVKNTYVDSMAPMLGEAINGTRKNKRK